MRYFKLKHEIINLSGIFSGSALTHDKDMPLTDYSVESMKATVVPNRNMVMLSIAASKAIQTKCDAVAYAAHAGDSDVYPDCRPEFVSRMREAINICDWHHLDLLAPYVSMSKNDIYQKAKSMGYDITKTWSCYVGGDEPCGQCGSCRSREDAVATA